MAEGKKYILVSLGRPPHGSPYICHVNGSVENPFIMTEQQVFERIQQFGVVQDYEIYEVTPRTIVSRETIVVKTEIV